MSTTMEDIEDSIISSMLMGGGEPPPPSTAPPLEVLSDIPMSITAVSIAPPSESEELGITQLFAAAALSSTAAAPSLSSSSGPPMVNKEVRQQDPAIAAPPSPTASTLLHEYTSNTNNMEPPFMSPRPLPPPLIPCIGYDDPLSIGLNCENIVGERPSFSAATPPSGDILEMLQSELIWLVPQYPTNRLVLMSPDDDDRDDNDNDDTVANSALKLGNSSSLEAEIVDILKNRAFSIPLTPMDERKVLDALSGTDIQEETIAVSSSSVAAANSTINNNKQGNKNKKGKSKSKRGQQQKQQQQQQHSQMTSTTTTTVDKRPPVPPSSAMKQPSFPGGVGGMLVVSELPPPIVSGAELSKKYGGVMEIPPFKGGIKNREQESGGSGDGNNENSAMEGTPMKKSKSADSSNKPMPLSTPLLSSPVNTGAKNNTATDDKRDRKMMDNNDTTRPIPPPVLQEVICPSSSQPQSPSTRTSSPSGEGSYHIRVSSCGSISSLGSMAVDSDSIRHAPRRDHPNHNGLQQQQQQQH
mmetsp:Transcript_14707/g.24031  ORF Transcript_14707/g.24031 Transcript_14707/m.24031 type:complete len:526 (-) Transcript_14707:325-1902(-)